MSRLQPKIPKASRIYAERDELQRQLERYQVLQHISQDLVSELDHERLLNHILRSAVQVMEASAGALLLLDKETDELVFKVVEGGGGAKLLGQRMPRHQGISGWVLDNQQAVIVDDTLQDRRYYAEIGATVDYTTTSMICVPMTVRDESIGVLEILNKQSGERFDESDQAMLVTLAAQSAIAIRNAQLYQDVLKERDRLVAVEEDVRKDLARDLHDGPTQLVAAIMMNLQFVQKLLEREPEKVDAELDEISGIAERAMRQLRTMLFDLRPVILETSGLIPALEAYSSRLTETERFTVQLAVHGDIPRLNKQADSAIFAIVQEAISNAKKHAQAKHIEIDLYTQQETLHVNIYDDGKGFDIDAVRANYASRGSLGLINMRERAEMIQGNLVMESAVGKGTSIRIRVPLSHNLRS